MYNRGHNKSPIFLEDNDYRRYLKRLSEYLPKHAVSILSYCLMPNHIHLLLKQTGQEPIDKFIHRLHTAYTMFFNKKYERVGSVFQGRFKAKQIETDEYLLHVSRYIHLNPKEILQSQAQGPALRTKLHYYPWSSLHEYLLAGQETALCQTSELLNYFATESTKQTLNPKANSSYIQFVDDLLPTISEEKLEAITNGDVYI